GHLESTSARRHAGVCGHCFYASADRFICRMELRRIFSGASIPLESSAGVGLGRRGFWMHWDCADGSLSRTHLHRSVRTSVARIVMNFHTIIHRELLIGSKRSSTFYLRSLIAACGGIAAVVIIKLVVKGAIDPDEAG